MKNNVSDYGTVTEDVEVELTIDEEEIDDEIDEDDFDEDASQEFDPSRKYSNKELEEYADSMLREDSNRELCKICHKDDPDALPYGEETGQTEWKAQYTKAGEPCLDSEGNLLYVAFPQMQCENGHLWYKGEGVRRALDGPNPILFEAHLYNRKRREIYGAEGVVDPAYTRDRWGKQAVQGLYGRSHPLGRKINSKKQRREGGAGFYR